MTANWVRTEPATKPRGRVLLAEDDDDLRLILAETLRIEGHDVFAVGNGVALLLELAQSARFNYDAVDVIVADVRMPLCSGIQVVETVRALWPTIPGILLTAFGDADLHAHAHRLGAVILDKPVSMEMFRRIVTDKVASHALQRAKQSRSSIR